MCKPNCNCGCVTILPGVYSTNMWNVNSTACPSDCGSTRPCNGCVDIIKGLCVLYTDVNLVNTGINKNDDLNAIIKKLDAIKKTQDDKNAKILEALNDINSRLNALENSTHAPYTLI